MGFIKYFAVLIICACLCSSAYAQDKRDTKQPAAPSTEFTLIFSGTKHFADVDVIQKNIKQLAGVKNLIEAVASSKYIRFTGLYSGNPESLASDIEGLSQDRFSVQSKNDKNRGFVITLKKLASSP